MRWAQLLEKKPGFQVLSRGLIVLLCAEVAWQEVPDHGALHSKCSAAKVDSQCRGTAIICYVANLRRCLPTTSVTGVQQSTRYCGALPCQHLCMMTPRTTPWLYIEPSTTPWQLVYSSCRSCYLKCVRSWCHFVASFIEIHQLSTEMSSHVKSVLTDSWSLILGPESQSDSSRSANSRILKFSNPQVMESQKIRTMQCCNRICSNMHVYLPGLVWSPQSRQSASSEYLADVSCFPAKCHKHKHLPLQHVSQRILFIRPYTGIAPGD